MMTDIKKVLRFVAIPDVYVVYDPAMQEAFTAKHYKIETPSIPIRKNVREMIRAPKEPTNDSGEKIDNEVNKDD